MGTSLRPTAIEYGLIYASTAAGADPTVDPSVLNPDDDPAFETPYSLSALQHVAQRLAAEPRQRQEPAP